MVFLSHIVCFTEIQNIIFRNKKPEDFIMHRGTHICCVSEDDALAIVVTDGFGCHGDRDERPMDF